MTGRRNSEKFWKPDEWGIVILLDGKFYKVFFFKSKEYTKRHNFSIFLITTEASLVS